MPKRGAPPLEADMLQGTLDLLILQALVLGPAHGHTIAYAIEHRSDNVLEVEHGSLYPALHRLGASGLGGVVVGHVGEQPPGPFLPADAQRAPPTNPANQPLAGTGECGEPGAAARRGIAMRWRRFFRRNRWDEERARELEAYLEIETDENIARGMSPEEARYAAQRKLGNTALIREEIYRMNSVRFLDALRYDLRFALRMLRKNPALPQCRPHARLGYRGQHCHLLGRQRRPVATIAVPSS